MSSALNDLRYAARVLLKQRGFTAIAVATLALGIGASTALFSIIDAALLHPLPYPHFEELVTVDVQQPSAGRVETLGPSLREVRQWRSSASTVAQACVQRSVFWSTIILEEDPFARVAVDEMSEGCLDTYGLRPALGRGIRLEDTRAGATPVVLLGYALWQQRYGGASDVIGRVLHLSDGPATIVGVMPRGLESTTDIVRPLRWPTTGAVLSDMEGRRGTGTDTFMRLRAGVTPNEAAEELSALAANGGVPGSKVLVTSLYADITHGYQSTARILAEAVGLILLLACVNVAGLLLARGATRYQELLVRASLGATRGRLVRQLLTESFLLAITGGVLGVLLARASLDAIVAIMPLALPPDAPASLSVETLMFAAIVSISSSVFFGLVPALRLSSLKGDIALANASRRGGPALSRRNGQALIAAEVAIAMVLLVGAGVLLRSFARLMYVDLGFDPSRVVALQVMPTDQTPSTLAAYYPALVDAVRTLPGVEYVGAVDNLPLIGVTSVATGQVPGQPPAMTNMWAVTPGYFEALGIPLLSGRFLRDDDLRTTKPRVVISQAAARKFFGTTSPIGRNLNLFHKDREVVGVVGDVKNSGAQWLRPELNAYLPVTQKTSPSVMSLVIRMRPGIAVPFERLRAVAQSIGPAVFVEAIRPGTGWLSKNTATPRHRTELFGLLGAFGLALALVGIFSMTAYAVTSRTREIGIRMALGARADQVVKTILGEAAGPFSAAWQPGRSAPSSRRV